MRVSQRIVQSSSHYGVIGLDAVALSACCADALTDVERSAPYETRVARPRRPPLTERTLAPQHRALVQVRQRAAMT